MACQAKGVVALLNEQKVVFTGRTQRTWLGSSPSSLSHTASFFLVSFSSSLYSHAIRVAMTQKARTKLWSWAESEESKGKSGNPELSWGSQLRLLPFCVLRLWPRLSPASTRRSLLSWPRSLSLSPSRQSGRQPRRPQSVSGGRFRRRVHVLLPLLLLLVLLVVVLVPCP